MISGDIDMESVNQCNAPQHCGKSFKQARSVFCIITRLPIRFRGLKSCLASHRYQQEPHAFVKDPGTQAHQPCADEARGMQSLDEWG